MISHITNAMKTHKRYNMINKKTACSYCKDDISKIENYEQAINDTKLWVCHHRLEMTIDGEHALTPQELIRHDMYYNRPYFELIFMPQVEHIRLHQNAHNSFAGKHHSKESIEAKRKWSQNIVKASLEYKEYKLNGGTLKWNDWQKEKFNEHK